MSGILSIGKSALNAAQMGLSVTGHNISNANTPGYSREVLVQSAALAQSFGTGFIGQGVDVANVSRIYNEILTTQVVNSQANSTAANTYNTQINSINNMLSDASAGINPALNNFFGSIQDLSSNPSDIPTRQTVLSNAQSLANRFQSTSTRLNEIRDNVNSQLSAAVGSVNTYAAQIASLNDTIEKTVSAGGGQPNDLMDQRDQLVLELSKQIKTTVVPQGQGSYNIYVGNGLPLVIGSTTMKLSTVGSPFDPSRLEVSYQSSGKTTVLGVNSLPGGTIGGLLQFRAESLDPAQNQIGQIATVLASDFNSQNTSGFDLNGTAGTKIFNIPPAEVTPNSNNIGNSTVTSTIVDAHAMTSSDYRLSFDGTNYSVMRVSDGVTSTPGVLPQTFDGVSFNITPGSIAIAAGDQYEIRPTRNAATTLSIAITDPKKLAMASSATTGPGDNANGLLMAGLQSKTTMNNSTTSYSSAFGQLINSVGNKSHELQISSSADSKILAQNVAAVQSQSGVNLDEEAANLIRYQQAYQAAGKMMQIASQLFDSLLQI